MTELRGDPCNAARRPTGYVTAMRGELGDELASLPTKRRYPLSGQPSGRWAEPTAATLARVLHGLHRL